jgi:dihydrolipoamide dehydrogenase
MSEGTTPYDMVIIGGGPGGYVAAIRAAQLGAHVALVEKDRLGGTCLNRGCIPTKAMVHDAELYAQVASGEFAVQAEGGFHVQYDRLVRRRQAVVDTLVDGVARLMASQRIEIITGAGRIAQSGVVEVQQQAGTKTLTARAIIVATGSVPAPVLIRGTDLPGVVTSDGLLALQHLPRSLVVLGASVVGIEFACIYHALGVQVSVVGRQSFLKEAEQQLAKRFKTMLSQRGVPVTIGVEFQEIAQLPSGNLCVNYVRGGKLLSTEGEIVLLSTGRWPYTTGLGLEELGIHMNGRAVAVNQHMETNVPGIYAIGDAIGGYMLAHVASYEGEVAAENIMGHPRMADYRVVPNCIFTMPEIADVGLTEDEAKEQGLDVQVSRFPFGVNGRALAMGEGEGQIRMICEKTGGPDGHDGKVLGVHIMGPRAGELIAEAGLAMQMGATAQDIAHTIHAHPTLSEAMMEVAMGQLDGAIHFERK